MWCNFYKEQKFYENIEDVYVVTCPHHPQFKYLFMNSNFEIGCHCLMLKKGRCNGCKTFCFILNCVANKIKIVVLSDVPNDVNLKKNQ